MEKQFRLIPPGNYDKQNLELQQNQCRCIPPSVFSSPMSKHNKTEITMSKFATKPRMSSRLSSIPEVTQGVYGNELDNRNYPENTTCASRCEDFQMQQHQMFSHLLLNSMERTENTQHDLAASKRERKDNFVYEQISKELTKENKRIFEELETAKLELKHCVERVQMPLLNQLENQRRKSEQLKSRLNSVSSAITNKECFYHKDIKGLENKLRCNCRNLGDIADQNSELYKQMRLLKNKCKELQDDILRQQMSRSSTLKRLNESLGMRQAMGDHGEIGKRENNDDLEMLDRALGQMLSEIENCYQCKEQVPDDLKETVKGIQRLIRMVRSRSLKRGNLKSVTLTRKPSPRLVKIPSDLTVTKSVTITTVRSKGDTTATASVHSKVDIRATTSIHSKVDISIKRSGETINIEVESKTAILTADQEFEISVIRSTSSIPLEKPINMHCAAVDYKDEKETEYELDDEMRNEELEIELEIGGKDINITTSVTKSGNLEIITESPTKVIESILTVTKSGNLDVSTDIIKKPDLKRVQSITSYESKTSVELLVIEESIISEEGVISENLKHLEKISELQITEIETDITKTEELEEILSSKLTDEKPEIDGDTVKEEELDIKPEDMRSLKTIDVDEKPEEETQTLISMEDIKALLSKPTTAEEIVEEQHLEGESLMLENVEPAELKPEESELAFRVQPEIIEDQEEIKSLKEEEPEEKLSKEIEIEKSLDFGSVSLDMVSAIGCKSIKDAEQETEKLEIQEAETSTLATFQEEEKLPQSADLLSASVSAEIQENENKLSQTTDLLSISTPTECQEKEDKLSQSADLLSIATPAECQEKDDKLSQSADLLSTSTPAKIQEKEENLSQSADLLSVPTSAEIQKEKLSESEIQENEEKLSQSADLLSTSAPAEIQEKEEILSQSLDLLSAILCEESVNKVKIHVEEKVSKELPRVRLQEFEETIKDSIEEKEKEKTGKRVSFSQVQIPEKTEIVEVVDEVMEVLDTISQESLDIEAAIREELIKNLEALESRLAEKEVKELYKRSEGSDNISLSSSCRMEWSKAFKGPPFRNVSDQMIYASKVRQKEMFPTPDTLRKEQELVSPKGSPFFTAPQMDKSLSKSSKEPKDLLSKFSSLLAAQSDSSIEILSAQSSSTEFEELDACLSKYSEASKDVSKILDTSSTKSSLLCNRQVLSRELELKSFSSLTDVETHLTSTESEASGSSIVRGKKMRSFGWNAQKKQDSELEEEEENKEEQTKPNELHVIDVLQEEQEEFDLAIDTVQEKQMEEEQAKFNELELQTEQFIGLEEKMKEEEETEQEEGEFEELKPQIEQEKKIESKIQLENMEDKQIKSDKIEAILPEKISAIKQEEAVPGTNIFSGAAIPEQTVSKLETHSAERLSPKRPGSPRRPTSPKRPGSPGKARESRTFQGSQEDRESKRYRDTREEPDKYKNIKDGKTCDCGKCTCQICYPEISKQMTADSCPCLPDCTCPVCSLSLPNMKTFKNNVEDDKWLTEGFGNKNRHVDYSEGQHPPGCECLDCLCNPPCTAKTADISRYWHLEDCDCLLCRCCASTDSGIKIKNPYASGKCLFEQARAKEQTLSTEEKTLSIMSDVLSADTHLSESATKKLSIVQIPRSSIEQQQDTQVITVSQTITNTTIQSEFIDTKTPHPTNCDCFDCLCEKSTTLSKTPSSQQVEHSKTCECPEDEKFNMQAVTDLENIIKQTGSAFLQANVNAEKGALLEKSHVARRTSSFILTMSGLKVALSSLQSECSKKDVMIAEMLKELKMRANSKVFDNMLHDFATARATEYDLTPVLQKSYLPKNPVQKVESEHPNLLEEELVSNSQLTSSLETQAEKQVTTDTFAQETEQTDELIDTQPNVQLDHIEEQPPIADHTIVVPLVCAHSNYPRCPCVNKLVPMIKVFPEKSDNRLPDQKDKSMKPSKKAVQYTKPKTDALHIGKTKPCHKYVNEKEDSAKRESHPKHHKKYHKCQCKENQPSTSKQQQLEGICPECKKRLAAKETSKPIIPDAKPYTKPKPDKKHIKSDSRPCACTKQLHKKAHSTDEKNQSKSLKKKPSSSKKCRCSKPDETRSSGGHIPAVDIKSLIDKIKRFLSK